MPAYMYVKGSVLVASVSVVRDGSGAGLGNLLLSAKYNCVAYVAITGASRCSDVQALFDLVHPSLLTKA